MLHSEFLFRFGHASEVLGVPVTGREILGHYIGNWGREEPQWGMIPESFSVLQLISRQLRTVLLEKMAA